MTTWIILGIVAVVALVVITTYNSLITARNRIEEAESDIEVQLKRRYELIPNLVNTVKGYAKHEKDLLEKVTAERASLMKGTTSDRIEASNQLTDTLKSLFAVAESYPDLKANENFKHLQEELVDSQDKIMAAQRFYNSNVRDFNTKLQVFPTNLYAASFGFKPYAFIEASETEKKNIDVQF
jgi:LemA protein